MIVVLLAAECLSGCAGLVMGSNASGNPNAPNPQPASTPQGQLAASPANASFASVIAGASSSQAITVSNSGSANATISNVAVSGAGFSTTGLNLPLVIAAGQSTTFNVTFAPATTASGSVGGSIALTSDASNKLLTIPASASVVAAARLLAASPQSASFPNVAAGSTTSQTITLTNSGNSSTTLFSISVSGTGFGTSGVTLPLVIAAGQSSTFNITFAAGAAATSGNLNGSISLTSDASVSTLMIPAAASVIAATRLLTVNPTSINFGNVTVGTNNSLAGTLTNNGNSNVTISGMVVNGAGFGVSGFGANTILTPNQSAGFNATFAPAVTGNAAGTISVASNATNPITISIIGTGVQPSSYWVALNWTASTSVVVGYNVYRQTGTSGTYAKLTVAPIALTQFQDNGIQSGQTYTYVVTSVDADANESDYSNAAAVTVP